MLGTWTRTAGWLAQTNPLSNGGTPLTTFLCIIFVTTYDFPFKDVSSSHRLISSQVSSLSVLINSKICDSNLFPVLGQGWLNWRGDDDDFCSFANLWTLDYSNAILSTYLFLSAMLISSGKDRLIMELFSRRRWTLDSTSFPLLTVPLLTFYSLHWQRTFPPLTFPHLSKKNKTMLNLLKLT